MGKKSSPLDGGLISRAPKGPLLSMAASRAPKGPLLSMAASRAPKGPLLSLMVEPPNGSLTVEPATASLWSSPLTGLMVEPASAFNLLIWWGGYGRAPPDLNSRACFRILSSRWRPVEHLKVQFTYPLSNK